MNDAYVDEKLPPMQRMAARALTSSYHDIVQVTVTAEAKANALRDSVAARRAVGPASISFTSTLLSLLAKTLSGHAYMNVAYADGNIRRFSDVNIGLAVASEDGLLSVPVVKNADQKTIEEIERDCRDLQALALQKKLRRDHLSGASMTLSNVGAYPAIRYNTPLVPVGQGAIIGIGAVYPVEPKHDNVRLPLSLSFDHRVINGLPASAFLQALVDEIERVSAE